MSMKLFVLAAILGLALAQTTPMASATGTESNTTAPMVHTTESNITSATSTPMVYPTSTDNWNWGSTTSNKNTWTWTYTTESPDIVEPGCRWASDDDYSVYATGGCIGSLWGSYKYECGDHYNLVKHIYGNSNCWGEANDTVWNPANVTFNCMSDWTCDYADVQIYWGCEYNTSTPNDTVCDQCGEAINSGTNVYWPTRIPFITNTCYGSSNQGWMWSTCSNSELEQFYGYGAECVYDSSWYAAPSIMDGSCGDYTYEMVNCVTGVYDPLTDNYTYPNTTWDIDVNYTESSSTSANVTWNVNYTESSSTSANVTWNVNYTFSSTISPDAGYKANLACVFVSIVMAYFAL